MTVGTTTLIALFCLLLPWFAAHSTEPSAMSAIEIGLPFAELDGLSVDSIIIENRNIYDLDDPRYQGFLFLMANRLHLVTRERIIRQELLLKKGDKFSAELAAETVRNLRTRFPMNEAWVEVEPLTGGSLLLRVISIDQWSLVGGLRSVDHDGQETDYQIGFEERNFLGRAQFVSFDFYARENDPDYIEVSFREPRVMGQPIALGVGYRDNPNNTRRTVYISRPYYSLSQRERFRVQLTGRSRLLERFGADGDLDAQWRTAGEDIQIEAGYRWGSAYRKTELFAEYRYLFKEIVGGLRVFDSLAGDLMPPEDSVYHQLRLGTNWTQQRFIVERRIRGFDYSEDIGIGWSLSFSYGRAFRPGLGDHYYDVATGQMGGRQQFNSTIVAVEYLRSLWFRGDEELRRLASFEISLYNNHLTFVTFAARSLYVADRDGLDQRLVVGGKSGLRGYPTELMAGNRLHVLNLEGRVFPGLEFLSVKIGGAVFADVGRTWRKGEALTIKDYRLSAGAGLRLSLEALRKGEIVRLDIAAIEGGGIEFSFGTGQYF